MKRNMDIVRRIALATAELEYGATLGELEGVDQATFGVHVMWMLEAGLIRGHVQEYQGNDPPDAWVNRLTWEGNEFADAVRSDTVWTKAKANVIKPSASFTFGLLKEWLSSEIRDGFPTLRG